MNQQQLLRIFPDIEYEEMATLMNLAQKMEETQQENFLALYKGRRREPQLMLILTLVGFLGVAGIQRFLVGDIALGIIYFFTGGLCLIGTIIDLINIKNITLKYNQKQAYEAARLATAVFK